MLSLIEQYGWTVVFLGTLLQSAGVPLPAQTVLMVSGFLVQQGHMKLWQIIVSGILGTLLGGPIGYWVSHEVGRPFVLRWAPLRTGDPQPAPTRREVLRAPRWRNNTAR